MTSQFPGNDFTCVTSSKEVSFAERPHFLRRHSCSGKVATSRKLILQGCAKSQKKTCLCQKATCPQKVQKLILVGAGGKHFFHLGPPKAQKCESRFEFQLGLIYCRRIDSPRNFKSIQICQKSDLNAMKVAKILFCELQIRLQKMRPSQNSNLFLHFVASGGLKSKKLLPSTHNKIRFWTKYQFLCFLMAKSYLRPLHIARKILHLLGIHISEDVTFPGKSNFPGSHISREVKFPRQSHFSERCISQR